MLSVQAPILDRRRSRRRYSGLDSLTAFELHILELLRSGLNRFEISQAVGRSPQTISNSLTNAKDKLAARSLPHAAVLAFRRSKPDRRKSR